MENKMTNTQKKIQEVQVQDPSTERQLAKLQVINYSIGEEFKYLRENNARNACYSSDNAIKYKLGLMSKQKGVIDQARPTEGSKNEGTALAQAILIYRSMEAELAELDSIHEDDQVVCEYVTGKRWTMSPSKTKKVDSAVLADADAILGDDNRIQLPKNTNE